MYASSLSTVLTVDAGAVRFRQGLFSQTDRAMNLSRVQDVTVQRSFWQRLWGIGDIMIESASESGRIVITDIDHPRQVADLILAASRDARTSS